MSAIGDYIHFTAAGYERHGTKRWDMHDSNYASAASVLNDVHNRTRQQVEKQKREDLTGLSEAIQSLMLPPDGEMQQSQRDELNHLWQQLETEFRKEFENDVSLNINRAFANVLAGEFANINVDSINSKNKGKNTKYTQLDTILKRIGQIERSKENIKEQMARDKLEKILDDIYNQLEQITEAGKLALQETGYALTMSEDEQYVRKVANRNIKDPHRQNIITAINRIAATTSGIANLRKGDLFEWIIAVAPLVGTHNAVTNLKEYIEQSVVGTSGRTEVTFNPSRFIEGVDFKKVLGKSYTWNPNQQLYVSNISSQDKVDVQIDWRGTPMKISAKNINFKSGRDIHLLSGASLLSLLTYIGSDDFVNHYLNIVAIHKDKEVDSNLINLAHSAIKPTILLQAFEGYKPGDKAEIFIVNDNTTGQVKVFNIADLILKALSNDNLYQITANGGDISSLNFNNDWADSYGQRITNLLANVHAQKIEVSIKTSIL